VPAAVGFDGRFLPKRHLPETRRRKSKPPARESHHAR
jgi:hypothetical protein